MVLKHIIYVQNRPDMSMEWVGCLNHNPQNDPSEKPTHSPTAFDFECEPQHTSGGAVSLYDHYSQSRMSENFVCMVQVGLQVRLQVNLHCHFTWTVKPSRY